jgi:hypothetical protein
MLSDERRCFIWINETQANWMHEDVTVNQEKRGKNGTALSSFRWNSDSLSNKGLKRYSHFAHILKSSFKVLLQI